MSEANVEQMLRWYEVWNRGDFDFGAEQTSPDWEFHLHHDTIGLDRVYRGREGYRKFADDWAGAWQSLRADLDRVIDVDDQRVLALCHLRGSARDDMELSIEYAHLATFVDGVNTRLDGYPSWKAGIGAAGLDPAELEDEQD